MKFFCLIIMYAKSIHRKGNEYTHLIKDGEFAIMVMLNLERVKSGSIEISIWRVIDRECPIESFSDMCSRLLRTMGSSNTDIFSRWQLGPHDGCRVRPYLSSFSQYDFVDRLLAAARSRARNGKKMSRWWWRHASAASAGGCLYLKRSRHK